MSMQELVKAALSNSEGNLKIEANGIVHSYTDSGGGNIPLIFIHGFPFNKSTWQPQLDFFQEKRRVVAYDIRGFGDSGSDERENGIDLFADDLIALMDALKIDHAIVCGLSMGGYILMNAISRFPERFKAIILCDTQCNADSPETKEKRYETIQQISDSGLEDYAQNSLVALFSESSLRAKKSEVEKIRLLILSNSIKVITETLKALAKRKETCTSLSKITIPTLILCGAEDTLTPPMRSHFLLHQIFRSTFHTIELAGHLTNIEQPDIFNEHLDKFLSEIAYDDF